MLGGLFQGKLERNVHFPIQLVYIDFDRVMAKRPQLLATVDEMPTKERVLVHRDQVSQYGSSDYLAFMKANNIDPSMSRTAIVKIMSLQKAFLKRLKNV